MPDGEKEDEDKKFSIYTINLSNLSKAKEVEINKYNKPEGIKNINIENKNYNIIVCDGDGTIKLIPSTKKNEKNWFSR